MRLLAVFLWNWIRNWTIVVVGHGSLELKVLRVELRMGVLVVKVGWLLTIIDYVGMQAKLVLVIIIKFIVPYNEFYS